MNLLIGGRADGRWLNLLRPVERIDVPVCEQRNPNPFVCDVPLVFASESYRREELSGPSRIWAVYVHESLTIDDAMERLIKGYNPAASKSPESR